jgi:FdrA protein
MTVVHSEVRPGVYHDSIVLMQLQAALADLPDVLDAGVVMGTPENLATLEANHLPLETLRSVRPGDLVLVVRAATEDAASDALAHVDALLARTSSDVGDEFRPRSLSSAIRLAPEAGWVLISVPGQFAAAVARESLRLGRHVFLYSDNVPLAEEIALKRTARGSGLLLMGPDCGTALVGGIGFGFANRVRRGGVGLVGASGTGIQAISSRVDALGAGVSHAIGTGGRDLQAEVGGVTALQGLELLARDPDTRVIVLVSKPPERPVVRHLLAAARATGKPVVVNLLGYAPPARRLGCLHFATGLDEAASMAVELLDRSCESDSDQDADPRYLRGLFSGGTLALEVLQGLRPFLDHLHSNVAMDDVLTLPDPFHSQGHTILDLGADEFTVGRPHPMIDNDLRLRRLDIEAKDPEVGLIMLDIVLGHGAHPDPAAELGPAIEAARAEGEVEFVAILIGTDEDPQDVAAQEESLTRAGARVHRDASEAVDYVVRRLRRRAENQGPQVELDALRAPAAAINVGLESFYDSLVTQGVDSVQIDWRPPAGGNEKLMAILDKMRR